MAIFTKNEPANFVVFGATGDLSIKKLFPSLFQLFLDDSLAPDLKIFAVVRQDLSTEAFAERIKDACHKRNCTPEQFENFVRKIECVRVDIDEPKSFKALKKVLSDQVRSIFYFSVSPSLFGAITVGLRQFNCINPQTRVVVEKPIGHNLATAQEISQQLSDSFDESQIFRIDHYLGKETVQNIMALRFGNAVLEPLWCAERIQSMQITVAEEIGVANRGPYYDHTGALRDMVQNHLLQLLCIVAMEPPAQLNPVSVRDEKLKVLHSLRPIQPMDVVTKTVRGQYIRSPCRPDTKDYLDEKGVNPDSQTETFVAVKAEVDNWRWAGMPVYMRTGKHLPHRASEIVIQFKDVPHKLFKHSPSHLLANRLVISLQPKESIKLYLNAKAPGRGMTLQPVALDLDLTSSSSRRRWEAYERLILDIIQGDLTLFMRETDVLSAWKWIDPIMEGWAEHMPTPEPYEAGTWGPVAANQLLAKDGFIWHDPAP
jgi:glucose-6-phosphate 1-dehydrogenase